MDQKLLDGIMSEFDKLSHNEQVDLFLEIRGQLLKMRDARMNTYRENANIAQDNIETLAKGSAAISNPADQKVAG